MLPPLAIGESTPLPNQVAGHDGVMSDASGSLVIKPALPREIAFYQTLNSSTREDPIRRLKSFVPKFYGTLRLEGQLSSTGSVEGVPGKEEVPESVVIENLSYAFTHPNIIDVKLGTVLYGPDASDEKKARMDKQARETTTHETGVRLTGFTTWHERSQSYIVTPKSFGKTIPVSKLPEGMTRFFPLPSDIIPSLVPAPILAPTKPNEVGNLQTIPEAEKTPIAVDVENGIPPTPITASNAPSIPSISPRSPSVLSQGESNNQSQTFTNHAIPPGLTLKVLSLILEEIDRLTLVLSELEIRFVGASLLIVYEGDSEKLPLAIERYEKKKAIRALKANGPSGINEQRSAFSEDGSNASESDSDSQDENSEDNDDEDEEDDKEGEEKRERNECPPIRVKMIDFAHTWLTPDEGPDQGVLLGLKTLKGLIEGRKAEIEFAISNSPKN
ncbi:uncharacterized protein I303_106871 [Kwoniella dejecticola CBS 10117]|uniref:Kinase n=1 Tax=Kwoniella dejecticola CBS 10117 TaxID=1296121 RepID=A0A1A5ZTH5_9TREE|nr:uncharacterized protein I303_08489 [Kwoniella dejecticola CBS 10117]OBR81107.1 hypothetical protein I303_08489 [Kwoniella dejecticola CBS 10117]